MWRTCVVVANSLCNLNDLEIWIYLTNLMEPRVVKVCINDGIILEKENYFIRVQVLNNAVDAQVVPEFKALWCTPKVVHLVRLSMKRVLQLLSVSAPIIYHIHKPTIQSNTLKSK